VDVVGTTVDRSRSGGLHVNNKLASGHLTVHAFNNVFAHLGRSAISVDATNPATQTLRFGDNDTWEAGEHSTFGGAGPGRGNLHADPLFVDERHGRLALRARSPLVDAGLVCSPAGVADPDAAGRNRLAGRTVDLGAYERGATPPTGLAWSGSTGPSSVLIGTAGDDILCGGGRTDKLEGGGGRDYIDGGPGRDFIYGLAGSDRLFGGPGPDTVIGGPGGDRIFGGGGSDICLYSRDGGHGNDRVDGGPGRDHYRADRGDTVQNAEARGCVH
jgi:Ca2+-binding RTX toxin-like protein